MSLLQEMEKYGLADCEYNRKLWQEDEIKKILKLSDCIEDHLSKNGQCLLRRRL
jgi:hypothetical protein